MHFSSATDTLKFHEPGRTLTFTLTASNCPQFEVDSAGHTRTYLVTGNLDAAILQELGLPTNYGRG